MNLTYASRKWSASNSPPHATMDFISTRTSCASSVFSPTSHANQTLAFHRSSRLPDTRRDVTNARPPNPEPRREVWQQRWRHPDADAPQDKQTAHHTHHAVWPTRPTDARTWVDRRPHGPTSFERVVVVVPLAALPVLLLSMVDDVTNNRTSVATATPAAGVGLQ